MGKYQKKHRSSKITILLFLTFFAMAFYAGVNLLDIRQDYAFSAESYDNLAQQFSSTVPTQIHSTDPTESTAAEPLEYAPIRVDFENLLQEGPEIIGWLYCADTVINYPIVHHANNDYYLDRLPNSKFSPGGTIFLDCENSPDLSDWNSILYGHNMNDDSMFGTLPDYRKQEYYDEHPVMYFLTPTQDYRIDIIGGYTTLSTSDTYSIPYDEIGRDALVEKAVRNTEFQPSAQAGPGERLITLSTCTYEYDEARFVIVGVLRPLARPEEGGEENA